MGIVDEWGSADEWRAGGGEMGALKRSSIMHVTPREKPGSVKDDRAKAEDSQELGVDHRKDDPVLKKISTATKMHENVSTF